MPTSSIATIDLGCWQNVGGSLDDQTQQLRIYLAGRVCVVRNERVVTERAFPGPQARLVFSMLALEHSRPVPCEELIEQLWPEGPPMAWDQALRAIVSKLRSILAGVELDGKDALSHTFGSYQLHLPPDAWIDLEAAADAVHRAEAALRAGEHGDANGWTLVAAAVARRSFLPGSNAPWVLQRREDLKRVRVRALECRAEILIRKGNHPLATRDAEEVVASEPFRETGYQLLMRAHADGGNPAEALRVYDTCRRLLADELGTSLSEKTEALYLDILLAGGSPDPS